jgi:hypothetical protein
VERELRLRTVATEEKATKIGEQLMRTGEITMTILSASTELPIGGRRSRRTQLRDGPSTDDILEVLSAER